MRSLSRRVPLRVLSLALALALAVPAHGADDRPLAGRVVSVVGTVLLRKEGQDFGGAPRPLKPGDPIREGDVINTSSDGKAKLLMQDRTILDVGSSALFHVKKFSKNGGENRDVDLSMMYGSVRANVTKKLDAKGKFRIRTPSATMGVRGTQFIVVSGLEGAPVAQVAQVETGRAPQAPPKTEVVVIDGKVEVKASAPVPAAGERAPASLRAAEKVITLGAGQGIVADAGAAKVEFKPMQLSTEQLGKALEVAKVEDNTFRAAISLEGPKPGEGGGQGPGAPLAAMNVTAAAVQETVKEVTVKMAQNGPMNVGASGIAGAFSGANVFNRPPVDLIAGGLRRVRVIITR
jgi:hypothetical protein